MRSAGAPHVIGVLVDVPVDRGAGGVLHRLGHREVGESLGEVDRAVLLRDARHLRMTDSVKLAVLRAASMNEELGVLRESVLSLARGETNGYKLD